MRDLFDTLTNRYDRWDFVPEDDGEWEDDTPVDTDEVSLDEYLESVGG